MTISLHKIAEWYTGEMKGTIKVEQKQMEKWLKWLIVNQGVAIHLRMQSAICIILYWEPNCSTIMHIHAWFRQTLNFFGIWAPAYEILLNRAGIIYVPKVKHISCWKNSDLWWYLEEDSIWSDHPYGESSQHVPVALFIESQNHEGWKDLQDHPV